MRPIKYRGKRKDNGEWVYGYYIKIKGKNCIVTENAHLGFVDIDILKKEADIKGGWYEVIPETVGQFVCLDKNGKEVWEGDIVRFSSNYPDSPILSRKRIGEVFFKTEGSIDYCFKHKEGPFGLNSNDVSCYEVIGNVHESPELIEETNA